MRVAFLVAWLVATNLAVVAQDTAVDGPAERKAWHRVSETQPHMGSRVTIVAYAQDESTGKRALEQGFERIRELNAIFSDYDSDSECSELSRSSPHSEPVVVSDEMVALLGQSLKISRESGGAFDVTVGPLARLWSRARHRKQLPKPESLDAALKATGYQLLELDVERKTVSLQQPKMRLDFGGIAKGYIADAALAAIRDAGCARALVNAGGDIAMGEAPPARDGWRVGVAPLKPRDPPSRILQLANCGIATSGDAWQYLAIDGKRFSHIIDPRTGKAVERRFAVTVIAPTCGVADGLASAVSVVGPELGLPLVEKFDATTLVVEENNGKITTASSAAFPAGRKP